MLMVPQHLDIHNIARYKKHNFNEYGYYRLLKRHTGSFSRELSDKSAAYTRSLKGKQQRKRWFKG